MKVIYLAGPYRSHYGLVGIILNIVKAWVVSKKLWGLGYVVLCPHTNSALMGGKIPESVFLSGDEILMKKCDAVVLLPGWQRSEGTLGEIAIAIQNKIPVFLWQDQKIIPMSCTKNLSQAEVKQ